MNVAGTARWRVWVLVSQTHKLGSLAPTVVWLLADSRAFAYGRRKWQVRVTTPLYSSIVKRPDSTLTVEYLIALCRQTATHKGAVALLRLGHLTQQ